MATKTKSHTSIKHSIVDRSNKVTLISVAIAVFIVISSAFAVKALFSQSVYLNKVIDEKETALKQLETNKENLDKLKNTYEAFVTRPQNVLTGNPNGEGPLDGTNDKIINDSLPDKYDFPALSSSFEKILKDNGYAIESIGGSEDASLASNTEPTPNAEPILIPYSLSFTDTTERANEFLSILERSIRPMFIDSLSITSGAGDTLSVQLRLHTYFTNQTTFDITSKEVPR